MDNISRMKMKDMNDEDIFAIFTEYVRGNISKDLSKIYKEEACLLEEKEPWLFRLDNLT